MHAYVCRKDNIFRQIRLDHPSIIIHHASYIIHVRHASCIKKSATPTTHKKIRFNSLKKICIDASPVPATRRLVFIIFDYLIVEANKTAEKSNNQKNRDTRLQ